MATARRVLIATVSVGAGHVRAAEAVQEAMLADDPRASVDLVDVLSFGPAWANRLYRAAFLGIARVSRRAASELYLKLDREEPDSENGHLERIVYRRFSEFVARLGYDDVVCTHFLPARILDQHYRPALHMVVTDYALHRYWVQPNVDNFFVATEEMAATLQRRLPRVGAHVAGIPVRARFRAPLDGAAVRRELRIPENAPVVLVMGGGWGLGVEDTVWHTLNTDVTGLHLIAVCGANLRSFERLARSNAPRLRAFAHVDDTASLMAAADLIVSKPGGVTTSEAIALRKPLLLTRGVPGQEDRNAAELSRLGVAEVVDGRDLTRSIEHFFASSELRRQRFSALERVRSLDGAEAIARHFSLARERCA